MTVGEDVWHVEHAVVFAMEGVMAVGVHGMEQCELFPEDEDKG